MLPCVLILLLFAGCSNEITDQDLELWTKNEEGLKKMREVVADSEVSQETRIRAMLFMVDAGKGYNLRDLLDQAIERDEVVPSLRKELLKRIKDGGPVAWSAKQGIFTLLPYIEDPETRDNLLKELAEWAFDGLDDESSTNQIQKQIEHRITVGEITRLGKHGTRGAALLISRAFDVVPQLFQFMISFNDPAVDNQLLQALEKYEKNVSLIPWEKHLERIYQIGSVNALKHLFKIQETLGTNDQDIAEEAGNRAFELLDEDSIKALGDEVIPLLLRKLETKNPDHRWYLAEWILLRSQEKHLQAVLDAFKDDKVYANGRIDPHMSLLDFCNRAVLPIQDKAAKPIHGLVYTGNRIQQAVGLTCLKIFGSHNIDSRTAKKLRASKTDLSDFLGEGLELGPLTRNTLDSIDLIQQWEKRVDKEENGLSRNEFESRRYLARTIVDKVGEELKTTIEKQLAAPSENTDTPADPEKTDDNNPS